MTQNRVVSTLGDSSITGKNLILNGAFDSWSRGTSFSNVPGPGTLTADRWTYTLSGTGVSTNTVTQDTSVPSINSTYSLKYTLNTTPSVFTEVAARQMLETHSIMPLVGKTGTLSFWYKSSKSGSHGYRIIGSVQTGGTDQGGTFTVNAANTWEYKTIVVTAFSGVTAITTSGTTVAAYVDLGPRTSSTYGQTSMSSGDYFQLAQVQLELGSTATSFARLGGTIQLETTSNGSAGFDGVLVSTNSSTNGSGSGTNGWAGYQVAGKNAIINGGMDLAQRGTSFALTQFALPYTLDRWQSYTGATTGTWTVSQVASGNANFKSAAKLQRTVLSTQTGGVVLESSIETQDSLRFASSTVTFSFYAKAGSNALTTGLTAYLITGTGTDQNIIIGFTGQSNAVIINPTLTTSWQRFSGTATLGAITQLAAGFGYTPTGTAGADDSIYLTGVQIELGSTATNFSRAGGTIQGELAAAQRYYYRNGADTIYQTFGNGSGASTTIGTYYIQHPVLMRVAPTSIDYSTLCNFDTVTVAATAASVVININQNGKNGTYVQVTNSSAVLTQYRPYFLIANNSSSAYLGFGAEL